MLGKIYKWLLWIFGAALEDAELEELKGGGDRLTFWFRRSKKRLGWIWWAGLAAGTGFVTWLILHIQEIL